MLLVKNYTISMSYKTVCRYSVFAVQFSTKEMVYYMEHKTFLLHFPSLFDWTNFSLHIFSICYLNQNCYVVNDTGILFTCFSKRFLFFKLQEV